MLDDDLTRLLVLVTLDLVWLACQTVYRGVVVDAYLSFEESWVRFLWLTRTKEVGGFTRGRIV